VAKSMMQISFDPIKCRAEIIEFGTLLASKPDLSERDDIQPFFKSHEHLSALMGTYAPEIGPATEIVFEYPKYGNFRADLIVGNKSAGAFLLVEFEDGRLESIFRKTSRDLPEWSPRFEHGFSQIVDWFCLLDDLKKTDLFKRTFGEGYVSFSGLLVIGRDSGLTNEYDQIRLSWRSGNIALTSQPVVCVTFDQLHSKLDWRLKVNTGQ
jgi:Domain of unknown function (DUF4263)